MALVLKLWHKMAFEKVEWRASQESYVSSVWHSVTSTIDHDERYAIIVHIAYQNIQPQKDTEVGITLIIYTEYSNIHHFDGWKEKKTPFYVALSDGEFVPTKHALTSRFNTSNVRRPSSHRRCRTICLDVRLLWVPWVLTVVAIRKIIAKVCMQRSCPYVEYIS